MRIAEYDTAVMRGMDFLDRNCPDWIDRIDLVALDVGAHLKCPLAQSYGSDFDALQEQWKLSCKQCENLGFMTAHSTPMEKGACEYDNLTAAWGTAILKRRRENARKAMDRIVKTIIRGITIQKPNRRRSRAATTTRS